MKTVEQNILINVLTRTSNRPNGFKNCHNSIINQTYKNVKHLVSYDDIKDLHYLNNFDIIKVKVAKCKVDKLKTKNGFKHAPYNSYLNTLLNHVKEGWVLFLDDDDHLYHNKVLEELVTEINKNQDDTLYIFQMRYPTSLVLPSNDYIKEKKIELGEIGGSCILFHSKYKNSFRWDNYRSSDFRIINALFKEIPHKKWIQKIYIQVNNLGDLGRKNDINKGLGVVYNKSFLWFLIPKYHFKVFTFPLFSLNTYKTFLFKFRTKINLLKSK